MHLVERYALSCGAEIDIPHIYEKYFPIGIDKYITLHTTSKDAKNYDYWQEVVDILLPILNKENIGIVQIGSKDEKPLIGCYLTLGQTTINQTAYIIQKGLLHVGTDSFPVHMAGHFDKPLVALYSNNWAACVKPYWGDPSRQILMEPDRTELKPSFSLQEFPKRINSFKPEKIAENVCSLLKIPFDYPYETLCIGDQFNNSVLENAPNQVVNPADFNTDNILVRMDYHFDETNLATQLSMCKCSVVTDRPINPNILAQFKPHVIELQYEITNDSSADFVKILQQLGLRFTLFSFLAEDEVEKQRIKFMDYGLIHTQPLGVPKECEGLDYTKLLFKSNKFTLSNRQIFASRYSLLNKTPIPNIGSHLCPITTLENIDVLWREKRHLRIVKLK